MRKRLFLSIVIIISVISGCTQPPVKEIVLVPKKSIEQQESFDVKLEEVLKEKGSFIDVRGLNKEYKEGAKISFIIDTKRRSGYLYIMSVDNDSVTFLQPNPNSPLSQMRGVRSFPADFTNGTFDIQAVKNCKDCAKEKTTIYALLTKKPVENIEKKITGGKLLSFYKNSNKSKLATKGIKLNLSSGGSFSNLSIGKSEFFVK